MEKAGKRSSSQHPGAGAEMTGQCQIVQFSCPSAKCLSLTETP